MLGYKYSPGSQAIQFFTSGRCRAEALFLPRLRNQISRVDLRASPPKPLRGEPGQREALAEEPCNGPLLRALPSKAPVHTHRHRARAPRPSGCVASLLPPRTRAVPSPCKPSWRGWKRQRGAFAGSSSRKNTGAPARSRRSGRKFRRTF